MHTDSVLSKAILDNVFVFPKDRFAICKPILSIQTIKSSRELWFQAIFDHAAILELHWH